MGQLLAALSTCCLDCLGLSLRYDSDPHTLRDEVRMLQGRLQQLTQSQTCCGNWKLSSRIIHHMLFDVCSFLFLPLLDKPHVSPQATHRQTLDTSLAAASVILPQQNQHPQICSQHLAVSELSYQPSQQPPL